MREEYWRGSWSNLLFKKVIHLGAHQGEEASRASRADHKCHVPIQFFFKKAPLSLFFVKTLKTVLLHEDVGMHGLVLRNTKNTHKEHSRNRLLTRSHSRFQIISFVPFLPRSRSLDVSGNGYNASAHRRPVEGFSITGDPCPLARRWRRKKRYNAPICSNCVIRAPYLLFEEDKENAKGREEGERGSRAAHHLF